MENAEVIIEDHGPGISEEDLEHIFERFYRGDKSRTHTSNSGFGLGLSIAKWITEKHSGRIEVQSSLGEGTRFVVILPITGEKKSAERTLCAFSITLEFLNKFTIAIR